MNTDEIGVQAINSVVGRNHCRDDDLSAFQEKFDNSRER